MGKITQERKNKILEAFIHDHLQGHKEPETTEGLLFIPNKYLIAALKVSGDKEHIGAILKERSDRVLIRLTRWLVGFTITLVGLTLVLIGLTILLLPKVP